MYRKIWKKVCPSDFNVQRLLAEAEKGNLFLCIGPDRLDYYREECRNTILQYVEQISDCTSCKYQGQASAIWHRLLDCDAFATTMMLQRGAHWGQPNYYWVTAIVDTLLVQGVYDAKRFTVRTLHLRLEHVQEPNCYYQAHWGYLPSLQQLRYIREIVRC